MAGTSQLRTEHNISITALRDSAVPLTNYEIHIYNRIAKLLLEVNTAYDPIPVT